MCLLILSINEKRRGKADGTPKEHFQGLFISRKMKYVMAFKKHISAKTTSQKTLMLASFAIARPPPEVKALQRGFKLTKTNLIWLKHFPHSLDVYKGIEHGSFPSVLGQCFSVTRDSNSVSLGVA